MHCYICLFMYACIVALCMHVCICASLCMYDYVCMNMHACMVNVLKYIYVFANNYVCTIMEEFLCMCRFYTYACLCLSSCMHQPYFPFTTLLRQVIRVTHTRESSAINSKYNSRCKLDGCSSKM